MSTISNISNIKAKVAYYCEKVTNKNTKLNENKYKANSVKQAIDAISCYLFHNSSI
ncbi:16126_t:CDS:2 [Dentiscutata erythropus]|uniref:16126_t:CDS:1 n=1 Tax=Dentiscutata erythropus TaxID=1348616 RepID=A0A9N8WNJ0_9GLOM|nr:16126_t:CDS:2 [Dentiscutata erythropus]